MFLGSSCIPNANLFRKNRVREISIGPQKRTNGRPLSNRLITCSVLSWWFPLFVHTCCAMCFPLQCLRSRFPNNNIRDRTRNAKIISLCPTIFFPMLSPSLCSTSVFHLFKVSCSPLSIFFATFPLLDSQQDKLRRSHATCFSHSIFLISLSNSLLQPIINSGSSCPAFPCISSLAALLKQAHSILDASASSSQCSVAP